MQRDAKHLPIYAARAAAYSSAERWDDALQTWYEALAIDPEALGVRINIMAIHFRQGEYQEALRVAEADQAEQSDLQFISALCHLELGEAAKAWGLLEDIWRTQPEVFARHAALVGCLDRAKIATAESADGAVVAALEALYDDQTPAVAARSEVKQAEQQEKGFGLHCWIFYANNSRLYLCFWASALGC